LQAIGDSDLLKTFEDLKELQAEVESLYKELTTKQKTHLSLQQKELKNRDIRNIYDKRELIKHHMVAVQNCIKWKKFNSYKLQVIEAKKQNEEVSKRLSELGAAEKRLSSSLAGYLDRHSKAKDSLKTINEQFTQVPYSTI
jgi:predicted  nucleic acid-binding Zn-ribbon protein